MGYWPSLYQFPNYYKGCSRLVHTEQWTFNTKVSLRVIYKVFNSDSKLFFANFLGTVANIA